MLKVMTLFSGVGSQEMALKRLGIPFEVVAMCEIDKFAIQSYEAIHGPTKNLGDISKVHTKDFPKCDLLTYSFPCQDISVAGNMGGFEKGSGTRSSLLWECARAIVATKPKYLLMENVKALVSKKFNPHYQEWLDWLERQGYTNYSQVLNAKDYGVPQNRERVFCVSILGEHEPYEFPAPIPLTKKLRDVLEDEVDEKFYLKDEIAARLIFKEKGLSIGNVNPSGNGMNGEVYRTDATAPTLTTNKGEGNKIIEVGNLQGSYEQGSRVYGSEGIAPTISARDYKGAKQIIEVGKLDVGWRNAINRVYDDEGLSPTLTTMQGGHQQPKIIRPCLTPDRVEKRQNGRRFKENDDPMFTITTQDRHGVLIGEATKTGYAEAYEGDFINLSVPGSATRRGRVGKEIANTLDTGCNQGTLIDYRIRKLTPLECWRLMDFTDDDFHKAQAVVSNSQLYKQAGNSIVVACLEGIFRNMKLDAPITTKVQQTNLFEFI